MTNPVYVDTRFTSVTVPSIRDAGIEEPSSDIHPIVSMEDSHHLPQSALSNTDSAAQILRPDRPTPDLQKNEMGETSQTPAATQLTFLRHELVPISVTGSAVPSPHSFPVQQPDDFSETWKPTPPVNPLHPLDSAKGRDLTVPHVASDIT
jgi:hypothetical protein